METPNLVLRERGSYAMDGEAVYFKIRSFSERTDFFITPKAYLTGNGPALKRRF